MASIRVSKKVLYSVIIAIILTFAVSALVFKYIPEMRKSSEINEYKKAMYNSVLCQYKCPLTEQTVNNKTQLLPEVSCVKTCTDDFRQKEISKKSFTNNELLNDNLVSDLGNAINGCKAISLNDATLAINNTLFFSCSIESLEGLKANYTYLK